MVYLDSYFIKSFKVLFKKDKCGFSVVNEKSLKCIKVFYDSNKNVIGKISSNTYTNDFISGNKTNFNYPKAKIFDMYGFTLGISK
jgi:hypothetical protein